MPPIQFTDKDIMRGRILAPGWYHVRIDAVGEKLSKNQESTNYPVEATVIRNADTGDAEFAGVPLDWMFNSKALGFAVGYLKALGIDVTAGSRYDLSATAGREIEVFVKNDQYEGRLVNRVDHQYRPVRG